MVEAERGWFTKDGEQEGAVMEDGKVKSSDIPLS